MDYKYEIESTSTIFDFQIRDISRALKFFMLVLDREGSSWDEMGMCCDNVTPEI